MDISKSAAVDIITGQLENFRDGLFVLSGGNTPRTAVEDYVLARRFFFRERSGFPELADMAQLNVPAVREQLRREETQCLEEAGLGEVNFAGMLR